MLVNIATHIVTNIANWYCADPYANTAIIVLAMAVACAYYSARKH